MSRKIDRLHDELTERRAKAFADANELVMPILMKAAGVRAARDGQDLAKVYHEEKELPEESPHLPSPLRKAWRRWASGLHRPIPKRPEEVLPIPRVGAEVWTEARRLWREEGDVEPLLQIAVLRAFREEHGDADRMSRYHLSPFNEKEHPNL